MNQLHIYPTSRALRSISQKQTAHNGFLPTLMRMDEFEQRSILVPNKIQIDPLKRILLLRKAAHFDAFEDLKLDLSLVRFFTKSDALFKFFEELAHEGVGFDALADADAYAEFGKHLEILERLLDNYQNELNTLGFTDKAFIPNHYQLNVGFLKSYESIEVHLEGYLNRFELALLDSIAKLLPLKIYYTTSKFNIKMQEAFQGLGIALPNDKYITFSLSDKSVLQQEDNDQNINASVYAVEERLEQIALAFVKIDEMVKSGIAPEEIVLILPDESFKEQFRLFDVHNNLNFAMGYDYSNGAVYKSLDALDRYWQGHDEESKKLLMRYGFSLEALEEHNPGTKVKSGDFFILIDALGLHESPLHTEEKKKKFNERVYEKYNHFTKVFEAEDLSLKEWLFLWLKSLATVTIDDVRGGKITVMGVLETRGVSFEGVVIVDFNEGIVPASSSKDQFLNSSVRAFANLPTKNDREALQKQYYKRLLEQAKESAILYATADNKLPSKFLYELGLAKAIQTQAQFDLLYAQPSQLTPMQDPLVENFDATAVIWSASRLKTYLDCKRKYYYRYIQKIKPKTDTTLNEGQHLHRVLETLFEKRDNYVSKEEMQKELDMLLDTMHPLNNAKAEYQKLLWKEKLKGFIEQQIEHFTAEWKVVSKEQDFYGEIGGLKFKGRIDRIDQNNTETLILDYKSGNVENEPKKLNPDKITDFQMSVYHQLLQDKYQNIRLAFLKIFENGMMQEVTLLDDRNQLLFEKIVALKQTKSFVAEKCEDLQKCKWCEFQLMCQRGEYL